MLLTAFAPNQKRASAQPARRVIYMYICLYVCVLQVRAYADGNKSIELLGIGLLVIKMRLLCLLQWCAVTFNMAFNIIKLHSCACAYMCMCACAADRPFVLSLYA